MIGAEAPSALAKLVQSYGNDEEMPDDLAQYPPGGIAYLVIRMLGI